MKSATVTKWQLTEKAFDKLLAALAADRETAGEKYILLKSNLVRFFEIRGFNGSEDAADEVLNRLARKIEFEIIENPTSYALGIARMVGLELRKSPLQKTSNELPEISIPPIDKATETENEKLECLDECLGGLTDENHGIIVEYYKGEKREKIENRNRLAEALGIPINALRNRAVRLRDNLEICITNCLRKL